MFPTAFLSKKEISKLKISPQNPLTLTCEKITETPRVFNTTQIKNAIENVSITDPEEKIIPELIIKTIEYTLKDLFLFMHQTGLYNRQFKLWKTIGNITQCSVFKLQKGLLKKLELDVYIIDFFIDPKNPCIRAIINEKDEVGDFKTYLPTALTGINPDRLKGILYFSNYTLNKDFIKNLSLLTDISDSISKYESTLLGTNDVRLNVITFKQDDEKYTFHHSYPEISRHSTISFDKLKTK